MQVGASGWLRHGLGLYGPAPLMYNPPMLTGKQRHYLRGLAHSLRPLVQVGKDNLNEALIAAIDQALLDHELIKVKIGEHAEGDRHEMAERLGRESGSEVAQVLGNTIILYRAHPANPRIALPVAARE